MKFTAAATFFSSSPIRLAIGCTIAIRKVIKGPRVRQWSLDAIGADLKPAPERANQAVAHGQIVCSRWCYAPHRLRPGGIAMTACNHVHMQLRHLVAERRGVELVDFGRRLEHARRGVDLDPELIL